MVIKTIEDKNERCGTNMFHIEVANTQYLAQVISGLEKTRFNSTRFSAKLTTPLHSRSKYSSVATTDELGNIKRMPTRSKKRFINVEDREDGEISDEDV